jgi:ketosteroid isomerase-like protein
LEERPRRPLAILVPVSEQNVEVVRALFPAVGVDMVAAMDDPIAEGLDIGVFTDDCKVEFLAERISEAIEPRLRGPAGLVEGWTNWTEAYESYVITPEEFVDAGEEVLVLVRVEARTERGGVAMEHRPAAVFAVSDGRIHRARFFLDRGMAFSEAGVDPTGHA